MEFFKEIERQSVEIKALKDLLTISALPALCSSINSVISEDHNVGEIYCIWGQFNISREVIRNGVRFALLDCPHAFAWTITYHEERNKLVVHCTIDDQEEEEEFIETIEQFASDWSLGLRDALPENR